MRCWRDDVKVPQPISVACATTTNISAVAARETVKSRRLRHGAPFITRQTRSHRVVASHPPSTGARVRPETGGAFPALPWSTRFLVHLRIVRLRVARAPQALWRFPVASAHAHPSTDIFTSVLLSLRRSHRLNSEISPPAQRDAGARSRTSSTEINLRNTSPRDQKEATGGRPGTTKFLPFTHSLPFASPLSLLSHLSRSKVPTNSDPRIRAKTANRIDAPTPPLRRNGSPTYQVRQRD